jgi:hypothetical protein
VNCIKSSDFCRHGLRGAVENDVVNLNEFEGVNERKNSRTSPRDFSRTRSKVRRLSAVTNARDTPRSISRHSVDASAVRVPRAAVPMSRRRQSSIVLTMCPYNHTTGLGILSSESGLRSRPWVGPTTSARRFVLQSDTDGLAGRSMRGLPCMPFRTSTESIASTAVPRLEIVRRSGCANPALGCCL